MSLNSLLENSSKEELQPILENFKNILDEDIQNFLNKKAILFQERQWCSVYLLVDEEWLSNKEIKIDAYFTLSIEILNFSKDISKNKKKKLANGIQPVNDAIPVILIGQIGKYIKDSENYAHISMKEIIDYAETIILSVQEKIVCSVILVECKSQNTKLLKKYQENGFDVLQETNGYIQLVKKF